MVSFADEITKAAAQTQIAVESIQRLNFAASQADVDLSGVTRAVNRLQVQLVGAEEGSAQAAQALARLGIPVQDFINLAPDEQFARVAQQIAAIENPAQRTAAAVALFGKSGAELLPVLSQTGSELAAIDQQFVDLGGPVSAEAIASVDQLGDSFGAVTLAVKSLGTEILAIIAPTVTKGLDLLNIALGNIRFAVRGGEGDNEIVNLSNEIDRLQGKAAGFKDSLNPQGRTIYKQLIEEIDTLQRRLDVLTETGTFRRAILEPVNVDPSLIQAPKINFEPGPKELTPEERRAAADAKAPAGLDFSKDNFELIELSEREHLDRLLALNQNFVDARFEQQNALSSSLQALREEFGVAEINFEELKAASITDIQASIATSGLQIATALFGQNKKVALAVAAINIGVGATEALKLPFPANIAAVAKVLAQGAQLTARIRSASIGGGGGFGGAVGGGVASGAEPAAAAEPAGATSNAATTIYINGFISRNTIDDLVSALRDEVDRDVTIIGGNSRQAFDLQG